MVKWRAVTLLLNIQFQRHGEIVKWKGVEYYNKIKKTTYAFNVSSHVRANVFYKLHTPLLHFILLLHLTLRWWWWCVCGIEAIQGKKVVRMTVMVSVLSLERGKNHVKPGAELSLSPCFLSLSWFFKGHSKL